MVFPPCSVHPAHVPWHISKLPMGKFSSDFRGCKTRSTSPEAFLDGIGGMKRTSPDPERKPGWSPERKKRGQVRGRSMSHFLRVRTHLSALGFNGGFLAFGLLGPLWNTSTLTSTIFACKCIDRSAHSVRKDCAHCAYSFDLQRAFERILTVRTAGKMSKSRLCGLQLACVR